MRVSLGVLLVVFFGACNAGQVERQPLGEGIESVPDSTPEVVRARTAEVFVSVDEAVALIAQGASVLDARDEAAFSAGHLPGAVNLPWAAFVDGALSGRLSDDVGRIQAALRAAGVSGGRTAIVYGDWNGGWGEEGRLFWMLEYLGHEDVRVLFGGGARWQAESRAMETGKSPPPAAGDFSAQVQPGLRVLADELAAAIEAGGSVIVLDTRDQHEFEGATPYGAERGGHIPGAKHFSWKSVFQDNGNLHAPEAVRASLREVGAGPDTIVVSYCTGGVRSGFMYMILRWLGFNNPQNYDGSWWEWASRDDLPVAQSP